MELNDKNDRQHNDTQFSLNHVQQAGLVILRVFIGWHFLYEGMIKWTDPEWSASVFLKSSTWILSGFFIWLTENDTLLAGVDFVNQAGLVIIGIAFIAGFMTRTAAVTGIVLLGLYYLAFPPLFDGGVSAPGGDQYLLIDKNLIEMAGLYLLFAFRAGNVIGIDALIKIKKVSQKYEQ